MQDQGCFPFGQKFWIFQHGGKLYGNFLGRFLEIQELLNFQNVNHLTENSGNCRSKIKWDRNGKECLEKFGIPSEVFSLSGNSRKFCSQIHHWKCPEIQLEFLIE